MENEEASAHDKSKKYVFPANAPVYPNDNKFSNHDTLQTAVTDTLEGKDLLHTTRR